jgi:glutamate synthase domain-containing protein 2/glutamate synthase domain-containing protein 1/glutamate synthase domain-containing protein 3
MDGAGHDACGVGFVAELSGQVGPRVLPFALRALGRLAHRGAVDADGRTGDGAGVLTGIPGRFLASALPGRERDAALAGGLGVGMLFLPRAAPEARAARTRCRAALEAAGLRVLGFRDVPVREDVLGATARSACPRVAQVLVARPEDESVTGFERRLLAARRAIEARVRDEGPAGLYVVSLSARTVTYKALVRATDLAPFYPDLEDEGYETAFAAFHQRFSTNTAPAWPLAQPFRVLAHNGEINTIAGNRRWMRAREGSFGLSGPLLSEGVSDSASLDEALDLLTARGRDLFSAVRLLLPPAFENDPERPRAERALFEWNAGVMEPWDGPALAVFADGRVVGAALDRNGLRPARYAVTSDGLVCVASEAGVLDVEPERILERGRLGPGDLLAVDLRAGRLLRAEDVDDRLARARPYDRLLRERLLPAPEAGTVTADLSLDSSQALDLADATERPGTSDDLRPTDAQDGPGPFVMRAFGVTREERRLVLRPMADTGGEPVGSMGDDTPLAVFSPRPRLLSDYFRQRFAQVTNPPIDSLREGLVMSLRVRLGPRPGPFSDPEAPAGKQVELPSPVLDETRLAGLARLDPGSFRVETLSLLFEAERGRSGLRHALGHLLELGERLVREGAAGLVLSDRAVDESRAPMPPLLATSALHQHLVRSGLRTRVSLVVDTGEARDDHSLAALIAFGAEAVCPWLALRAVGREGGPRYRRALEKGLLKILAKMGISTLRSYVGAQLFEAMGLTRELVDAHFPGTPSAIAGVSLDDLADEALARHAQAGATDRLEEGGFHTYRRNGDLHAYAPAVVKALHAAAETGEPLRYREYARLIRERPPLAVRDLLELEGHGLPLDEVEPIEPVLARFMTTAMSLGALSPEAHAMLAAAMNRMGARSNSGEGGEDGARNRIKQVASARFGVTTAYLVSGDELQIKMAQGSKPGEGGQLPAQKAVPHIARVRHAPPGIALISPPPHHDIYSIEDLAQLVYDLKRVNPAATVGVKLVSAAGIGAVAVGVAKAHADAIVIGGHDGGTGASPLGSIKHAGTPWELGLSEVQGALCESGLRGRVRLQVEGGLKTGRDVVVAALLGADEFGFGSAALVAAGCVMARQCHLNTCPAGIATQREDLRARFKGRPEDVIRFFSSVAHEVREVLAGLGLRRLEDAVGRVDLLRARDVAEGKAATVRLSSVLAAPRPRPGTARKHEGGRNDPPETGTRLDEAVLARLRFAAAGPSPLAMTLEITNADRAVGARVAGELARRYSRLPESTLRLTYRGSAGQSFGAFAVRGMRLHLEGEANDYVGKGLSGGVLSVSPFDSCREPEPVLAGNAVLYGATSGRLFLAGRAGERFAVRNSGAVAVVEGVGDHGCEYMTAGAVVVLGRVGRNFGAGMTGGRAFVFDEEALLAARLNRELVATGPLGREAEPWLREALKHHLEATGSAQARRLLSEWGRHSAHFQEVVPRLDALPRLPAWVTPSAGSVRVVQRPTLHHEAEAALG